MKKYILLGLIIVVVIFAVFNISKLANFSRTEKSTSESITEAFAEKYDRPVDSIVVGVDIDTGQFAKGSIRFTDEQGGGLWFAAKTENGWELAFDGNGIIPCGSANKYDFPSDIIPQCLDEKTNNLIRRQNLSLDYKNCTYYIEGENITFLLYRR